MKYILTGMLLVNVGLPAQTFKLSHDDAKKIGNRIWVNECNGTIEGLISWHSNEKFPSLGIGHFIWFPESAAENYVETFPSYLEFLKKNNVDFPDWLRCQNNIIRCPWQTKNEFDLARDDQKIKDLRKMLESTIDYQMRFIIDRFKQTLDPLLKKGERIKRNHRASILKKLMATPQGLFVVIDYVNFKGSGLTTSENYNHQGWGLAQVLEGMKDVKDEKIIEEFIKSAQEVLEKRVKNAPKEKNEHRFLTGWKNRLNAYLIPL